MDFLEQEQLVQKLRKSQHYLEEGQKLSRTGTLSWCVETNEIVWSEELYRIFGFDDRLPVTLERIGSRVYPDDLPLFQDMLEKARSTANNFEYQHRLLMPDQSIKHIHLFAHATRDEFGRLEYVGAAQDVTDLHTITDAIANPVVVLTADGKTLYANRVALSQLGLVQKEARYEGFFYRACHPEDLDRVRGESDAGLMREDPFQLEMRLLRDGKILWHIIQYKPLKDESGKIIRWYATATDIDDLKRAEQKLEQSERELLTITDAIANPIFVMAPDGKAMYANRVALSESGLTLAEVKKGGFIPRVCHPDDKDREFAERHLKMREGVPFTVEMRSRKHGEYR